MPLDNIEDILEFLDSDLFDGLASGLLGTGLYILSDQVYSEPSRALREELKAKDRKLAQLFREREQLKKEFEKAKAEKIALRREIEMHRQASERKSAEISGLKEKIAALEIRSTMQSEAERARHAQEKAELERQLEQLEKENREHLDQLEELETKLETLDQEAQAKKASIEEEYKEEIYHEQKERIAAPLEPVSFTASYQPRTNILQGKFSTIVPGRDLMFRAVFGAIENHLRQGDFPDLEYYTLDVPMPIEGERKLVRVTRQVGDTTLRCRILKPYENEPMFPRLFEKGSTKPIELPAKTRKQAGTNFYHFTDGKCPWTDRQIDVLQAVLNNPTISSQQLAKKLGVSLYTIQSHYKEIQETAGGLFMLQFNPRKLVARYWHEMGFILL